MRTPKPTYKLYIFLLMTILLSLMIRGGIEPGVDIFAGYGGPDWNQEVVSYDSSLLDAPGGIKIPSAVLDAILNVDQNTQDFAQSDTLASVDVLAIDDPEVGLEEVTGEPSGEAAVDVVEAEPVEVKEPEKPTLRIYDHKVVSGDSLWKIAKSYGVEIDTIVAANELADTDNLRVGQVVKVPNMNGALHVVRSGESLWEIAKDYQVNANKIIEANNLSDPSRIKVKQELFVPGGQTAAANRYRLVSRSGGLLRAFTWPVSGGWISSKFGNRWGRMHEGLDIAVNTGTPVRAAAAGRVTFSGTNGGYGLLVMIDHGQGVQTRYGHNSALLVRAGQTVTKGQIIAKSGNTGRSTGPHVHFEIRLNSKPYDPMKYLLSR